MTLSDRQKRIKFFRDHSGYTVGKRMLDAMYLADAEIMGESLGFTVTWEPEEIPWEDLIEEEYFPELRAEIEDGRTEFLMATIYDECGDVLAHLGGIFLYCDDDHYRRIIEAELYAEAIHTISRG